MIDCQLKRKTNLKKVLNSFVRYRCTVGERKKKKE